MNKINKFLILGVIFANVLFIHSCVEDDDFQIPDIAIAPVDVASLGEYISFTNVISRYNTAVTNGNQVGVFSVTDDVPLYTVGYVISDDGNGNFFKEIIIQNTTNGNDLSLNDMRRGLKVAINARDLGGFYNFGRKVYIKLNGLAIGEENGVYTLGRMDGNNLGQIQDAEYKDFVIRDVETFLIEPKILAVGELTSLDENTFVQFNEAQFSRPLLSSTYAGEPFDEFDGFRIIETCDTREVITLQTSTFSDFKSAPLALGKGEVKGVYTRDFRDDFNVLIINTLADISFTSEERCDPGIIGCASNFGGENQLFFENFESFGGYTTEGWTMTNVNGGNVDWFISSFSGNSYSRISANNSNELDAEVWLVTPPINLTQTTKETLTFDLQANFDNGKGIEVYISNDFTGDIATATWSLIEVFVPSGPPDGFATNFTTIGPMNISCIDGNVNIAIVYKGSDPSVTTRYHLDNVIIKGE